MSAKPSLTIALITGQSRLGNNSLSPIQEEFLKSISIPDDDVVQHNFPYVNLNTKYKPTNLLFASLSNACFYLLSRFHLFKTMHQRDFFEFISNKNHTVLIAGSCGLELIHNLDIPDSLLGKLSIIAVGPVSRGLPGCNAIVIQGLKDGISRFLYNSKVDYFINNGHLNCLASLEVRGICIRHINNIRKNIHESKD